METRRPVVLWLISDITLDLGGSRTCGSRHGSRVRPVPVAVDRAHDEREHTADAAADFPDHADRDPAGDLPVPVPRRLLVYWVTTNLWTAGQQLVMRHRLGLAPTPTKRADQRDWRQGIADIRRGWRCRGGRPRRASRGDEGGGERARRRPRSRRRGWKRSAGSGRRWVRDGEGWGVIKGTSSGIGDTGSQRKKRSTPRGRKGKSGGRRRPAKRRGRLRP